MKIRSILFILIFLLSGNLTAKSKTYQVTRVLDGDTVILGEGKKKQTFRIAGMDAPEWGQPYSEKAKQSLRDLVLGRQVSVDWVGKGIDRYGRGLGHLYLNGENIAVSLIESGLAFYYRPTCRDYPENKKRYNFDPVDYVEAESRAKSKKVGVWSQKSVELACLYRKTHEGKWSRGKKR